MLGRTLKMAFWLFHDHLGSLLAANFLWAVSVAIPITVGMPALLSGDARLVYFVGLPAVFVGLFLLSPLICVGIADMLKTCIDTRDATLSDVFIGLRRYWFRAIATGALYGVIMIALLTSAWFYATRLTASLSILGYALSMLAAGSAAVLAAMSLLLPATIVQRKAPVIPTLKLALLLVLANPIFIFALTIQCLALTILAALIVPLFFVGYASAMMCIGSAAYELLSRKYDPAGDQGAKRSDADDDYLNRGFRDLFFPWKG